MLVRNSCRGWIRPRRRRRKRLDELARRPRVQKQLDNDRQLDQRRGRCGHVDAARGERGWERYDAYLWSNKEYQDFEIQFDYKVQKSGNSGFYFRVGDKKSPVANGIEVQIYESHAKGKDAKLTDHDSGGIIPSVPPTKNTARPANEWNRFHITSKDNKLTVKLNGEVVNEVDLSKEPLASRPKRGYIGFQDHAMPLALKDIKIREL